MKSKAFLNVILSIFTVLFIVQANAHRAFSIDQTNTSAVGIIGQPDYTTNLALRRGMWYPHGITQVGNRIFIAEGGPCRVSVYNNPPTSSFQPVDYAIGQPSPDVDCYNFAVPTSSDITQVRSVTSTGSKLIAMDVGNNRVLIWNTIPTTNHVPADVVLGQPDFVSNTINNGGISASSIKTLNTGEYAANGRGMVFTDGTKLYVADGKNNRVLIWNTIPTTNFTPADIVVGQPNMTSNTANNGGISARTLNAPRGVKAINGKLYICDAGNNRILIYNTIPTSDNAAADLVLGQSAFNTSTANNGGVSASSLSAPQEVTENAGKLYVADYGNHRVLIFNSIPDENFEAANVVLGQPNMSSNTSNNGGVSSHSLSYPTMASVINNKLYVVDYYNSRILIYSTLPTTNQADADMVLGQSNFTNANFKDGGYDSFGQPELDISASGKLVVGDATHNRVLIWNSIPSTNYPLNPDVILGQPDLQTITINTGGLSGKSLNYPRLAKFCGNKLVVADYSNNRVLIWNSVPTTDFQTADIVLGQPNMASNTQNNGGRSAKSLRMPTHVACTDTKLMVDDLWNHRILIWNTFPTESFKEADVVVGQPDFVTATADNGGVSNKSLNTPEGIGTDGVRLLVADTVNNRVLIWNTIPTTNFKEADVVVGQPNFTSVTANNGGISANTLNYPSGGITVADGRLIIGDRQNSRVLGWNAIPTSNFAPADFVIGQYDFASSVREVSSTRTNIPLGSSVYNGKIYVSDVGNGRITVYAYGAEGTVQAPALVSDEDITLQLEANGAKEMKVWEDGAASSATWESYSGSKNMALSQGDGTKHIYVKYRDYANYEGSVLAATTVLDTTAPIGSIVILSPSSNGYVNSTAVSLKLSSQDSVSGVKYMMVSSSSTFAGATWEKYVTTKSFILSSGDGIKTVYVKYKDAAGNISSSYGASVTLDTTAPKLDISKVGGVDFNESTQNYTVTDSAPIFTGTGEAGTTVTVKEGENILGTTLVDETGNWSLTPSTELENGTYNLMVSIEDKSGNKEVKGLVMVVKGDQSNSPNPTDNENPGPEDNKSVDKGDKDSNNSFNWYWILLLFLIIVILYIWYRNSKRKIGE